VPKPLIEVAGTPLIDWALDFVRAGGIDCAIINTSYLAQLIEEHVARRTHPHILISREPEPLETGGGIAHALELLGDESFLAMNSDAICLQKDEHPIARLQAGFDAERMDALLLLQPLERATGYDGAGDFSIAKDGSVIRRGEEKSAPYVFTGVQILHPRLFDGAPSGKFSMNTLYNNDLSRIHAVVHDGAWLHVGDVSGLARAEAFLAKH
jgi:MurNAc alpha-1-phosphate uridylyltransferase